MFPISINLIDKIIKSIEKERFSSLSIISDDILFNIKVLIDSIEEFGSYWKRNVPPLNLIYKRDAMILNMINQVLEECEIDGIPLKDLEPPLNINQRRNKVIFRALKDTMEDSGLL